MSDEVARRRHLAKVAWAEAFKRLFAKAEGGSYWPVGMDIIEAAEKAANRQTELYVEGKPAFAREALKDWENLVSAAIDAAKGKRGCSQCGVEKIAEVVMDDGSRACGKCRAGIDDGKLVG